jgi:SpoIID/LytB domain protein
MVPGTELADQGSASLSAVTITGFGFGHGRGMGQWGAFGYASEYGWSYQQVLGHYYGGTTLGAVTPPEPDVTVHLVELDGHNTIAAALTGGELVATWPGGAPVTAPAFEVARGDDHEVLLSSAGCGGPWREVGTTEEPVTIASAQTGPGLGGPAGGVPTTAAPTSVAPTSVAPTAAVPTTVAPATVAPTTVAPTSVVPTAAVPTTAAPASVAESELQACIPGIGVRSYQGDLVAQPDGQTQNVVGLEDYVDGVVPAESPASWANAGGEAALEAQAVAARSYALASIAAQGEICDDTACQMYLGLPDQYGPTADAAVSATAGEVLYCDADSSCGPAGSVALTEYSASTGGYTAGGAFPAVPDLGDSVAANPVHQWSVTLSASRVESWFSSIGTLLSIDVTARNGLGQIGGRVEELSVTGTAGSVDLTGTQFAADFSLPSDWFAVNPSSPGGASPPSTSTTVPAPEPGQAVGPSPSGPFPGGLGRDDGYWVVNRAGQVTAFGAATFYGTAAGTTIQGKVVAMAATPDYRGYWLAGDNGGVLAFGDAHWYGSASDLHLGQPVVAMASTPAGRGYWLLSRDGGVFAYGNAVFYGGLADLHLGQDIVGLAPTPNGRGYWLVASNGGIFAFGNAGFYGSAGNDRLSRPIAGIVASADGRGYYLVARDGGVFAFGDATFAGSLPSEGIRARVVAVAPTYDGWGYYILAASGKVYAFGDAQLPLGLRPARSFLPGGAVAIVPRHSGGGRAPATARLSLRKPQLALRWQHLAPHGR